MQWSSGRVALVALKMQVRRAAGSCASSGTAGIRCKRNEETPLLLSGLPGSGGSSEAGLPPPDLKTILLLLCTILADRGPDTAKKCSGQSFNKLPRFDPLGLPERSRPPTWGDHALFSCLPVPSALLEMYSFIFQFEDHKNFPSFPPKNKPS